MEKIWNIPHVEQYRGAADPRSKGREDYTCGAASLCMVFKYFGYPADHDTVWNEISVERSPAPGRYAWNVNILNYALNEGFNCTVSVLRAVPDSLKVLHNKGIALILNLQFWGNRNFGHYVVLTGINEADGSIYVNDPSVPATEGKNIPIYNISEWMRRNHEITQDRVAVALLPKDHNAALGACHCQNCGATFYSMSSVLDESLYILCPHCDHWTAARQ